MNSERKTVSGSICRIKLTGGNIRHHHFYLRETGSILPPDSIGGRNVSERGRPITVAFIPGPTVETDVDGTKMILRDRSAVREFLEASAAKEGDIVLLELTGDRMIEVRLEELSA